MTSSIRLQSVAFGKGRHSTRTGAMYECINYCLFTSLHVRTTAICFRASSAAFLSHELTKCKWLSVGSISNIARLAIYCISSFVKRHTSV